MSEGQTDCPDSTRHTQILKPSKQRMQFETTENRHEDSLTKEVCDVPRKRKPDITEQISETKPWEMATFVSADTWNDEANSKEMRQLDTSQGAKKISAAQAVIMEKSVEISAAKFTDIAPVSTIACVQENGQFTVNIYAEKAEAVNIVIKDCHTVARGENITTTYDLYNSCSGNLNCKWPISLRDKASGTVVVADGAANVSGYCPNMIASKTSGERKQRPRRKIRRKKSKKSEIDFPMKAKEISERQHFGNKDVFVISQTMSLWREISELGDTSDANSSADNEDSDPEDREQLRLTDSDSDF